MSQLELSRRTGIATSNISDWKKKKTNPKADCLLSICDALDITPEQLLTGKGIDPEYKDADMDYEVTRSDIKILKQIHSLGDEQYKRLMYNAKFSSADEVYASIYRQAKVSIYVVDNYIGLRTLVHLKNSQSGVSIILFSDNVGNNKLHNIEFTDFCKEYPNVKISMQKTGEIFHDRFIVLDYGTADERVFLCGASSKDAGARITSIVEDYGTKKYASVMATLLQNPPLVLPK